MNPTKNFPVTYAILVVTFVCYIFSRDIGPGELFSNWKDLWMSLKVIANNTIRQITYRFLLVFYSNYVFILNRFQDIVTRFCIMSICDLK